MKTPVARLDAITRKLDERYESAPAEEAFEPVKLTASRLEPYLGPAKVRGVNANDPLQPGVSRGLAYTGHGGTVLEIETARQPGRGTLSTTGNLKQVMQESAKVAFWQAKEHAVRLGANRAELDKYDYHVHVPAGAVPKDGPSAGHAVMTALVSLMLGRPVRRDVAMTGEITLQGKVRPVGGVPAKIEGGYLDGLRRFLIPAEHAGETDELDPEVRAAVEIILVRTAEEVLDAALEPSAAGEVP